MNSYHLYSRALQLRQQRRNTKLSVRHTCSNPFKESTVLKQAQSKGASNFI